MIEIGQDSEFEMSYDEAVMYCFLLGDGWRLPTEEEYWHANYEELRGYWFLDDPLGKFNDETHYVIPVRDLKDD